LVENFKGGFSINGVSTLGIQGRGSLQGNAIVVAGELVGSKFEDIKILVVKIVG